MASTNVEVIAKIKPKNGADFYVVDANDVEYNGQSVGAVLDDLDPIQEYKGTSAFPVTGKEKVVYIDTTENRMYRWSDSGIKYYEIGNPLANVTSLNGDFE